MMFEYSKKVEEGGRLLEGVGDRDLLGFNAEGTPIAQLL